MALRKSRPVLFNEALNDNIPNNVEELVTPASERVQFNDERESVLNYVDDLGGFTNDYLLAKTEIDFGDGNGLQVAIKGVDPSTLGTPVGLVGEIPYTNEAENSLDYRPAFTYVTSGGLSGIKIGQGTLLARVREGGIFSIYDNNASVSRGNFYTLNNAARLDGNGRTGEAGKHLIIASETVNDSGSLPLIAVEVEGTAGAITTRPIQSFFNDGVEVLRIDGAGGLSKDGSDPALIPQGFNLDVLRESLIVSDTVTPTGVGRIRIDTEGLAAADDLTTINVAGGNVDGMVIYLQSTTSSRVINIKANTGNIITSDQSEDFVLDTANIPVQLMFDQRLSGGAGRWVIMSGWGYKRGEFPKGVNSIGEKGKQVVNNATVDLWDLGTEIGQAYWLSITSADSGQGTAYLNATVTKHANGITINVINNAQYTISVSGTKIQFTNPYNFLAILNWGATRIA